MSSPVGVRLGAPALLALTLGCQTPAVRPSSPPSHPAADAAAAPVSPPGGFGLPPATDGGGAPPPPATQTCAREMHAAERVPVDLVLLVDASQSMGQPSGNQTKWQTARGALGAFVEDPGSAGLGVGLAFFPGQGPAADHRCTRDADCVNLPDTLPSCRQDGACFAPGLPLADRICAPGVVSPFNCPAGLACRPRGRCSQTGALCVDGGDACGGGTGDLCVVTAGQCRLVNQVCSVVQFGRLDVDIDALPGHAGALTAALAAREPDGTTPMATAVDSVLAALTARQKVLPERKAALVLATDGFPSCGVEDTVDGVTSRLQQALARVPPVPTYVVGVFSPGDVAAAQATFQRFASAGGTGSPFLLTTGADLSDKLLAALKTIRGQAVACEYNIPTPQGAPLDFSKVNVTATSYGQAVDLARVGGADLCDRGPGWYYDRPPGAAPSRIVLCPASCARLQDDPSGRVDLVFGCATRVIE
jgi:hypothetical protein